MHRRATNRATVQTHHQPGPQAANPGKTATPYKPHEPGPQRAEKPGPPWATPGTRGKGAGGRLPPEPHGWHGPGPSAGALGATRQACRRGPEARPACPQPHPLRRPGRVRCVRSRGARAAGAVSRPWRAVRPGRRAWCGRRRPIVAPAAGRGRRAGASRSSLAPSLVNMLVWWRPRLRSSSVASSGASCCYRRSFPT